MGCHTPAPATILVINILATKWQDWQGALTLSVVTPRTPSAPVLDVKEDKSIKRGQDYAVVVVLVSKVNQLQVRRLEAE